LRGEGERGEERERERDTDRWREESKGRACETEKRRALLTHATEQSVSMSNFRSTSFTITPLGIASNSIFLRFFRRSSAMPTKFLLLCKSSLRIFLVY
jgi:hypothetical protein